MNASSLAVVILAAGKGTRMKSARAKVLHEIAGLAMLGHVLLAAKALKAAKIVAVVAPGSADVAALAQSYGAKSVVQAKQLGTGHAVLAAQPLFKGFAGDVLVLFGDTPLLTKETLSRLVEARKSADLAVLGFTPSDATGYGRMVCKGSKLERIVEHKDANKKERKIALCSAGPLIANANVLFGLLKDVGNENAQGEYYLPDVVQLAAKRKLKCVAVEGPVTDMMGVNSRAQLAEAEMVFQARKRAAFMEAGVTLADPGTVYFSHDTEIDADVAIGPSVVFGPGVKIRSGVQIKGFCHIEGADVGEGAIIGPFARLRPGAVLREDVHVGNFVEVKNAVLDKGVKANHLTYLGDASVGEGSNIGAGTITCNYDGFGKYKTEIGKNAFIGSDTSLVAPVKVGDGAIIGAGSVITKDVAKNALALTRADQREFAGWAEKFRTRKKKAKMANAGAKKAKVK